MDIRSSAFWLDSADRSSPYIFPSKRESIVELGVPASAVFPVITLRQEAAYLLRRTAPISGRTLAGIMAMLTALRDVLETNHLPYLLRTHPRVYTSQATAAVQHVPADGQSGDGQERPTAHYDGLRAIG